MSAEKPEIAVGQIWKVHIAYNKVTEEDIAAGKVVPLHNYVGPGYVNHISDSKDRDGNRHIVVAIFDLVKRQFYLVVQKETCLLEYVGTDVSVIL